MNLTTETNFSQLSDFTPSGMREAVVGDALVMNLLIPITTPTIAMTRQPAASSATLSGSTIVFDAPGAYRFTVTLGGYGSTYSVICWPLSVLSSNTLLYPKGNSNIGANKHSDAKMRSILRSVVSSIKISDAVADGLTTAKPWPGGLVDLSNYGG